MTLNMLQIWWQDGGRGDFSSEIRNQDESIVLHQQKTAKLLKSRLDNVFMNIACIVIICIALGNASIAKIYPGFLLQYVQKK